MLTSTLQNSPANRNKTFSSAGVRHFDVTVIGAGPYGLSAAAHLKAKGLKVVVFGKAMDFWATKMPAGMLLRSPRAASNLADPVRAFTLDVYERTVGASSRTPVPLETFVEYGRWFQAELLPESDCRHVSRVEQRGNRFWIKLEDGESVGCDRVVIAAGISDFQKVPSIFSGLPISQVSHCYSGCDLEVLSKKRVAVIGAGQSALECAALLKEAGADVEVIARIPSLRWIGQHPWLHNLGLFSSLLYSSHDVGPAGISRLVAYPNVVKRIPLKLRDKIRTRAVRPAGSRWLPARLQNVHVSTHRFVTSVRSEGDQVRLRLNDGTDRVVQHVLLGTGYSVDIGHYGFLTPQLLAKIATIDGYPALRNGFESSVPGLYFLGATAARCFGPLLYFVAGTEFASRQLTTKILKCGVVRA